MSLVSAFTTAWKDVKGALAKADAYLTKNLPTIQSGVQQAEKVVEAAVPSLTPIVTTFDSFEEALVGEISAAIHDGSAITNSSGATTVTLSADLSAAVKAFAATVSGHPAVVAATTAKAA